MAILLWLGFYTFSFLSRAGSDVLSIQSPLPGISSLPAPVSSPVNDSWTKDFSVRNVGKFQVTNARGLVHVQGWALDKIRVKATRRILVADPNTYLKAKNSADFKLRVLDKDQDLIVEYGKNLEISEKNREHQERWVALDLEIQAPYSLPLLIRTQEGEIRVQNWQANTEVRSVVGNVTISELRAKWVNLLCQSCQYDLKDVKASLRILGGDKDIRLEKIKGDSIFLESSSGNIFLNDISAELMVLTKKGLIEAKSILGPMDLRSSEGNVNIVNARGSLNAHFLSGKLSAHYLEWSFTDQALIENLKGEIDLKLPQDFSGELDLRSQNGSIVNLVPFSRELGAEISVGKNTISPGLTSRRVGIVKNGGERLILRTISGAIKVSLTPKSVGF